MMLALLDAMLATRNAVESAGESIVGRRQNNEDAFRIRADLGLYLVADGMGGHEGGEVASRVAADTIVAYFEDDRRTAPGDDDDGVVMRMRMEAAIADAVQAIEARAHGELTEMGTTVAALLLDGDTALITHVGDSRVYRLRDEKLEALTRDHSFVNELDPEIADEMLETLPDQFGAMITRCIAAEANTEPDATLAQTLEGDLFLLCSDGLTDVLEDEEISALLTGRDDLQETTKALIEAAYEAGSHDNITCVLVRVAG